MNTKTHRFVWAVQIIMSGLFLLASSGKIISHEQVIANFDHWGYPYGFYMVIGIIELLCGLLLLHPKSAGYASIMLIAVMGGAVVTHIVHEEWLILLKPISHAIGLLIIFHFRFVVDSQQDDKHYYPLNELK